MDFGVTSNLGEYYLAEQYRKNAAAGTSGGVNFAEFAAAKAAENTEGVSFKEIKLNSMVGKIAIVIPPELEEKMKNDSELAKKVMERVDNFLLTNSTPGENEGFLMTFDENGEINHACMVGELKFTVSSSELVEARRAREAKHAEYERLAEESALKRKMLAQEADRKYYQNKAVSIAAYEAAGILK